MIKNSLSNDILKTEKPILIKKGNKYTGEIRWKRCNRFGEEYPTKPKKTAPKLITKEPAPRRGNYQSFAGSVNSGEDETVLIYPEYSQDSVIITKVKNQFLTTLTSSKPSVRFLEDTQNTPKQNSTISFDMGSKKGSLTFRSDKARLRRFEPDNPNSVIAAIREVSEKELDRIHRVYSGLELNCQRVLDLYKIYLLLFDQKEANMGINRFIKSKNVRKNSKFYEFF